MKKIWDVIQHWLGMTLMILAGALLGVLLVVGMFLLVLL